MLGLLAAAALAVAGHIESTPTAARTVAVQLVVAEALAAFAVEPEGLQQAPVLVIALLVKFGLNRS